MSVRRAIVEVDASTVNVSEFCRLHGVSRWTFYEVRARHAAEGEAALEPRSRAPLRVANRTGADVEDLVVAARKRLADDGLDCGAATIRFHLLAAGVRSPSESTVWRILTRRGFVTPEPRKRPRPPVRRFAADRKSTRLNSSH